MPSLCFGAASADFDGNDMFNCGFGTVLDITGDISLCAWFNSDSFASEAYLMGKDFASEGSASQNAQYSLNLTSGKLLKIFWESGTGTNHDVQSTSAFTANTGEWHFACLVKDEEGTSSVDFYFDGVKLGNTVSGVTNVNGGEDSSLVIGALRIAGTAGINGRTAYSHIYNRLLTAEEIQELFFKPGSIIDGLVLFVPETQNQNPQIGDYGNSCDDGSTNPTTSDDGPPVQLQGGGR